MELKEFIVAGIQIAGTSRKLAAIIGIGANELTDAKAHRRGLTLEAAVKLADYLQADLRTVIAANALATEKKEEKRRFWSPFVEHARAASFALAITSACVTSFVSPTPAEAAPLQKEVPARFILCQIRKKERRLKQRQLSRPFKLLFKSFFPRFAVRPLEMQPI